MEFHEERSKNLKRKRGVQESPVKVTKVTREGRIVRCGRCGIIGHNTRKCGNVGVEYIDLRIATHQMKDLSLWL